MPQFGTSEKGSQDLNTQRRSSQLYMGETHQGGAAIIHNGGNLNRTQQLKSKENFKIKLETQNDPNGQTLRLPDPDTNWFCGQNQIESDQILFVLPQITI